MENSTEVLQRNLKIELPHDPATPLLGVFLKRAKTLIWEDICTLMFIAALFTVANIWNNFKYPSIDEWMKISGRYICTYTQTKEYYSAIKKKEILPFETTWMDLVGIMFCLFLPCSAACGILVPQPGIKPGPLAVKMQNSNHCTSREFPRGY